VKTQTIHMDEAVLRSLKSAMTMRAIAGTAYGLLDGFIYRLLDNFEKDVQEWTPRPKGGMD
jgi:hypothetical protein